MANRAASGASLGLALGVAACSSSHTDPIGSSGDDGGLMTCATYGQQVDTFAPGLKKTGKAGLFDFVLVSSDPSPPNAPQMNTWTIRVLDKSGASVTDATVTLPAVETALGWSHSKNPWMPMGHGSSVDDIITNNHDGTAKLQIMYSMSGLWQTFVVAQSGGMTDGAIYSFCFP